MNINLAEIPTKIMRPTYDRSKLIPGIVHIGLGNFHRAHQAWYLHRLMQMGHAHDWAIIGAGVRSDDEIMRKKLAVQDYLTTLIELGPESRSAEVIGSMIGFVPVQPNNALLIAQMADPVIRIVSTTVTEGGYYIDPASKGFDSTHPDILYDTANPVTPRTAFGAMIAALKIRRDNGHSAFTCQSCDNLLGNGDIMRQTIVLLARLTDPNLADWIDQNSSFPNSMVDSIVPATGPAELELVKEFGLTDQAPVTHENFRQWVIEDKFCSQRPAWEKAGATITNLVHDYEIIKTRILNGGHQVIAASADLMGIETISEAMDNELLSRFFNRVVREEIMPHVKSVPEYTPEAYVALIDKRFRNPSIFDTTRRVAFDGSSRQPGFILPSIRDSIVKGIRPRDLALVSAIWARYCLGLREDGSLIEANDPYWDELQKRAIKAKTNPISWLDNRSIYADLGKQPAFADHFVMWLNLIYDQRLHAAMRLYLDG